MGPLGPFARARMVDEVAWVIMVIMGPWGHGVSATNASGNARCFSIWVATFMELCPGRC